MSIITSSHFLLVKARKDLERAFVDEDWDQIRMCDQMMGEFLNQAFDDDARNTKALVKELQKILSVYAKIVAALPDQPTHYILGPDA